MAIVPNANNAIINKLSQAVAMDPDVKARYFSRMLEARAQQYDDFAMFEAPYVPKGRQMRSTKGIICVKKDLKKSGGDVISFPVMGHPAGPGVIGERVLTGNTSKPRFKTYSVQIDFKRDAVEYSKKHVHFMGAGQDLWPVSLESLSVKMGLWKQRDAMHTLIRKTNGNILRPNGRRSRDELTSNDTVSTEFSVYAKNRATTLGAQAISMDQNMYGSRVHGYLFFGTDTALADIRNDTGYQNAISNAGSRGDSNPNFTGRLVEWQGLNYFEHLTVQTDSNDVIGSPLAPQAVLGTAFSQASTAANKVLISDSEETAPLYFQDFPGYDYEFVEGQTAAPDANTYYAWIINPDGTVGFVSYVGTSNSGNRVTLADILSPGNTDTLGDIDATGDAWGGATRAAGGVGSGNTSGDFTYTDSFDEGAMIIAANAKGVPIGYSYLFGSNALARCYGKNDGMMPIEEKRDFDFYSGHGFEGCWGQDVSIRSDGTIHGYLLLEHAIEHPGFEVPSL